MRLKMTFPVMHLVLEDRSDQRVEPGTAVEGSDQPFDHRLIDAGAHDDVLDDQIAVWECGVRVCALILHSCRSA